MDYATARTYLDGLQMFKIKLGLDAMDEALARLGSPHRKLRTIHLAGTNGKGSVGAVLTALFTAASYRVGFYSSPHLDSPRERFRIGETFISEVEFARTAKDIRDSLGGSPITYFEFTTALAFLWFARRQVDLAVIETGMGGRLDATNVLTPLVSVITNIGLDHEQYLGSTIAAIAGEKAGIIKPGVPVVSGVTDGDALDVIVAACRRNHSPLHLLGRDFSLGRDTAAMEYRGPHWRRLTDLPQALSGAHQRANTALAIAAAELVQEAFPLHPDQVRTGLARTRWPGRQEVIEPRDKGGPRFLLDGAHNPDGIASLRSSLAEMTRDGDIHLIWAAMNDKNSSAALLSLLPLVRTCILTRGASERFSRPEELLEPIPAHLRHKIHLCGNVADALQLAESQAASADLVCVAGSLYMVGEARCLLVGPLVGA